MALLASSPVLTCFVALPEADGSSFGDSLRLRAGSIIGDCSAGNQARVAGAEERRGIAAVHLLVNARIE